MKLPRSEPDFFLSKITGPRWLKLPIARTEFDGPFEFESVKFDAINMCQSIGLLVGVKQFNNIFIYLQLPFSLAGTYGHSHVVASDLPQCDTSVKGRK